MKIDSVSNSLLSPVSLKDQSRTPKATMPEQKTRTSGNPAMNHSGLTSAERAFFAKLFPEMSLQGASHSTYSASGIKATVEPGQIVNRKV